MLLPPRFFRTARRASLSRHRRSHRGPTLRRLRLEPLEDRRVLSAVTVTNNLDVVNGDTSSIANLIANDGGDGIALREAIDAANNTAGTDDVTFDFGHDGPETILLELGELVITEALTITGDGADLLTIDAQQNSRVINITTVSGDFTLAGLTVTGGRTTSDYEPGGAISSTTSGVLTIEQSAITNNGTTGDTSYGGALSADGRVVVSSSTISGNSTSGGGLAHGGAIRAYGDVSLVDSTLTDNSTSSIRAEGGGIRGYGTVTVVNSSVSGNGTLGQHAVGGGISASGDVTLIGSTVSDNSTLAFRADGGGIYSDGDVALFDSVISGNSTAGGFAAGGGIQASGNVTLTRSTISGNSTSADRASGAGILAYGDVTLTESTVSDNATLHSGTSGGGISSFGSVTLMRSTVSGNSTFQSGGGIAASENVTLVESAVNGNSTAGFYANGGGISAGFNVTLHSSTLSGNSASGYKEDGGGIAAGGNVTLLHSTITDNHVESLDADGGGIWTRNGPVVIVHSIVAGNTRADNSSNISTHIPSTLTVNHSLIGDTSDLTPDQLADINAGVGNLLDVDPMLGPLADNGGPTETHALLPGSPAIDAGDPAFVGPPFADQRGYYRVIDGDGDMTARVDMGAFEYASVAPLPGDGNLDGVIDGLDYLLWASHYGDDPAQEPPGAPLNGDFNGDGVVDGLDYVVWAENYVVWAENYGASVPAVPLAAQASEPAVVDAVMDNEYDGDEDDAGVTLDDDTIVRDWRLGRAIDRVFAKRRERGRF